MSLYPSEKRVIRRIYASFLRGSNGPWKVKYKDAPIPADILRILNSMIEQGVFVGDALYDRRGERRRDVYKIYYAYDYPSNNTRGKSAWDYLMEMISKAPFN